MNHLKYIERLNTNKNDIRLWYNKDTIYDNEWYLLKPGEIQYGPYRKYEQGKYLIIYYGNGLLKADFDVIDNHYNDGFNIKIINKSDNKIYYEVEINKELFSGVEFRAFNNKDTLIIIKYIDVFKYNN